MRREPRFAGGLQPRYLLLLSTFGLVALGLVMVYSASSVSDYVKLGDSAFHLRRQAGWIAVGLLALLALDRFDYRKLRQMSWLVWGIALFGLLLVPFIGTTVAGSRRWIILGGMQLQPSEYAKFGCVLVAAWLMTRYRAGKMDFNEHAMAQCVCLVPVVILVLLQPDMGTTMSIALAWFLVVVLGGMDWTTLGGLAASGVVFVALAILAAPYRVARFFAFLDPWKDPQGAGYQVIQGLLAFGSGGPLGMGLGMSRQKYMYLPAAHTDFIFAIVGEELGLVGTLSVVLAFGIFAYAGFRIATGSKDPFGRVLAGGLTAMIVVQALMNMAAVTMLMPVTGIPLPLVSYGGSSLSFTLACVGVILSVSRNGARLGTVRARSRIEREEVRIEVPAERRGHGRSRPSRPDRRRRVAG